MRPIIDGVRQSVAYSIGIIGERYLFFVWSPLYDVRSKQTVVRAIVTYIGLSLS